MYLTSNTSIQVFMQNLPKTKYSMVISYLLDYIKDNKLSPGDKLPTEKQLVEQLSTSRITIQRAIQELQQQGVIRRVQGGGTYVNAAPQPSENCINYIPMVLSHDSEYTGILEIIQGAGAYLSDNSCYLTIHSSHKDSTQERNVIQKLVDDGFKCIMVFPCSSSENYSFYFQLLQEGIHFVFIDRIPPNLVTNFVVCDNIGGGYMATKHLIQNGAKRISFISLDPINIAYSLTQRLFGYKLALQDAGLPIYKDYIAFADEGTTVQMLVNRLLQLPEPPDAIFCGNDMTAVEALNYLCSLHIPIPEQIKIIGFDNLIVSQNSAIPLSTIEQPFVKLGYEAARIAKSIICGESHFITNRILPVSLVERQSTHKI